MGIQDGRVVGLPLVDFTNTKANLLAITSPEVGMTAYATDTGELGFYTTGTWHWWNPDSVNHLIFNTSPTGVPSAEGVVAWNTTEKTLDLQTGWGPTLQVGHEIFVLVINGDPVDTIPNGSVVFPVTVFNGVPVVAPALASIHTLFGFDVAVATMDIPPESYGLATREGRVRNVDTSAWSEADTLYLSAENPGELTNVRPVFPNYTLQIAGCAISHATEGMLHVKVKGDALDTTLNFWNGILRESFTFTVHSNGTVVTGYLANGEGVDNLTMIFSDGLSLLSVSPPQEITLTPGTDDNPQTNYVYIPQSTKALAVSTSDWPVTVEHIRIATIVLRTAATTLAEGALRNQNWNDHIQAVGGQGHLSHIGERIRQEAAKWDAGAEGLVTIDATPSPDDVWVKVTGGVVYQMHRQNFPILDMTQYTIDAVSTGSQTFTISDDGDLSSTFPDGRNIQVNGSTGNDAVYAVASTLWSSPDFVITVEEAIPSAVADGTIGDDIHVVNHSTTAFLSTTNLNTQTLDATGATLANRSFPFVAWGIANLSGQESHLMLNLPVGSYGRLSPEDAVSDASNYSVYDIPKQFQGVGFLIARFIFQLQPGGLAWTIYATEDLRGKIPNVTAGGGGGGGGGATTWLALTDTPSAFVASRMVQANSGATALEFVADQAVGAFYAGPSVAPAAAPGFRAMVATDIAVAAASYAYLPGRAGGQVLNGGTGVGENLTLSSTAHATKGKVLLGSASAYSEVDDRLGIGTTAPATKLHLVGDGELVVVQLDSYGVNSQVIGRVAGGTQASPTATAQDSILLALAGRGYSGGFTTTRALIGLYSEEAFTGSNQGSYIRFDTTPSGSITKAEVMRVTGDRNVGIGTTGPNSLLHIEGSNNGDADDYSHLYIRATGAFPLDMAGIVLDSVGSNQSHLRFSNDGSPKFQIRYNSGDTANDKLAFYSWTQTSDVMVIDGGTGNVGIGTTAPGSYRLNVVGSHPAYFEITDADAAAFVIYDAQEGYDVLRVDADNLLVVFDPDNIGYYVGIGNDTPLDQLHVTGAVLRDGWFCGRAGTQTGFTGALTDIDIDTEIRKDSTYFTHSAGSDNITFIKTGWYRISYSIDIANSLSNNSCVRVRVEDDGGSILQSYGYCNLDYSNYGQYATMSNSFLAYIVAGSVIDMKTDGQAGTGSFGSGCNYAVLDTSQITIERVDQ